MYIQLKEKVYEFIGDVWSSDGYGGGVLYDDKLELADPTYGRTIAFRKVDNIMETTRFASNDIQTIGLSLNGKRRLDYANLVTNKGVERCPDIGLMTI